jgi:hypothetical protein
MSKNARLHHLLAVISIRGHFPLNKFRYGTNIEKSGV